MMPSMVRFCRRLRVLALVCALCILLAPQAAGTAGAASGLAVHLKVTGGYRYSTTLTVGLSTFDHFCAVGPNSQIPGTREYDFYFGITALSQALKGNFSADSFIVTIHQYRTNVSRYTDPDVAYVALVIRHHAYAHSVATDDPRYRAAVRITSHGLIGTLHATHLTPMPKFHGKAVNLDATWTCDTVLRSG